MLRLEFPKTSSISESSRKTGVLGWLARMSFKRRGLVVQNDNIKNTGILFFDKTELRRIILNLAAQVLGKRSVIGNKEQIGHQTGPLKVKTDTGNESVTFCIAADIIICAAVINMGGNQIQVRVFVQPVLIGKLHNAVLITGMVGLGIKITQTGLIRAESIADADVQAYPSR